MFKIPELSSDSRSINWKELPCSRVSLPLFRGGESGNPVVHYSDVVQGEIGSCWFLSALISYLRPNAKNLEERSSDIINSIKLYRQSPTRSIYKVSLYGKQVYIDDYIPQGYHNQHLGERGIKCMWFILFEKAMLSLMTFFKGGDIISSSESDKEKVYVSYGRDIWVKDIEIRHGEMKAAVTGIGYVVGGKTKYYALHKCDATPSTGLTHITSREIYNKFKSGEHLLANTSRMTYPGKKYPNKEQVGLAGAACSHCYAIIDIVYSKEQGTYLLTICNPWGKKEICENKRCYVYPEGVAPNKGISVITWEKFHHLFACVHASV